MANTRRTARRRATPRPSDRPRRRPRLDRLIDSEAQRLAHVGSWEWNAVTDRVTWSEELYRIYGLRPDQFDGTYAAFLRHVHPEDRERTREVIAAAFRGGTPFEYDHRIISGQGGIRMLQSRGDAVRDAQGKVVRLVGCCMDVTEQWNMRRRLDETVSLLRATLDSTADGIFVSDLAGKLVLCNRRAIELWNLPSSLAAARDLEAMIQHVLDQLENPQAFVDRERFLSANPELEGFDTVAFKDGKIFERYTQPQRLGDKVVGRVCSFRDITQRERAFESLRKLMGELDERVRQRTESLRLKTEELGRSNEDLARSNADLDMFAAAVSHDLRAPLRKISAFTELLETSASKKLSPAEIAFLERIKRAAARMATLIGDLLALSRVCREPLTFEEVDLGSVLGEVVSDLEIALARSGGSVEVGLMPRVLGLPSLWRRLFQNLIGNAVKFRSPERPPRVRVEARPTSDGVLLSVSDNGIGFDPKHAQAIFAPFHRLHPASLYDGSGLGLAICERIAQRLGARIWAESEPGKGSKFWVRLPASALAHGRSA